MSRVYKSRVFNYSEVAEKKDSQVTTTARQGGRRIMDHVFAGQNQAIPIGIRLFGYFVVAVLLMQSIIYYVKNADAHLLFSENGLLEWAQIFMLLLCAILLKLVAVSLIEIREGATLLSFMPLVACIRELDHILDKFVFDGAWQLLATVLLISIIYYTFQNRATIKSQLLRISSTAASGLFLAGFLMVMVFSRLFGQQSFWQFALEENYLRLAARIVEEGCEIFGYLLLVIACIELLIFAVSCKPGYRRRYQ